MRILIGQQVKQFAAACSMVNVDLISSGSIRLKVRYSRSPRTIPYQTWITPSLTIAMPSGSQIPEPVQPASLGPL